MSINKETIEGVAHLSRIELKPGELDRFSQQLQHILDFIDKLKKLEVENIPPTSHILPVANVLRKDEPKGSLPVSEALGNAPHQEKGFFVVPKVIE